MVVPERTTEMPVPMTVLFSRPFDGLRSHSCHPSDESQGYCQSPAETRTRRKDFLKPHSRLLGVRFVSIGVDFRYLTGIEGSSLL